jgi:hypothetical protein
MTKISSMTTRSRLPNQKCSLEFGILQLQNEFAHERTLAIVHVGTAQITPPQAKNERRCHHIVIDLYSIFFGCW